MGLEQKIRKLQDRVRNAGWRIGNIPWQEDGKPEYYFNTPLTLGMVFVGLIGFFGGVFLLVGHSTSIPLGIGVAVAGLLILLSSRFAAGYFLYRDFERVDAKCLDQEVRKFEDPDSVGSINRITYWVPRILCEFTYKGRTYRVTPTIAKQCAFPDEKSAVQFLQERMDPDRRCTLWINPANPLQTVFHKKPLMAVYVQ